MSPNRSRRFAFLLVSLTGLCLALAGCGERRAVSSPAASSDADADALMPPPYENPLIPVHFTVSSSAFTDGSPIPQIYTADGKNISPPLAWKDQPSTAEQFVVTVTDSDAPGAKPFVHWLIYNIPASVTHLPQGIPQKALLTKPIHAAQGENSFSANNIGYRGPAPPKADGPHHYNFKVFALDAKLDLNPKLNREALLDQIQDHILATGKIMGTYDR